MLFRSDRVDLRVFVENEAELESFNQEREGLGSTEEIRLGVAKAILAQRKRQGIKNAKLSPQEIQKFCEMSKEVQDLLDKAIARYGFSPRQ